MQGGGALIATAAALAFVCSQAKADVDTKTLLACSAEFWARAQYVQQLSQADPDHVTYLMGRSEMFLGLAEAISPNTVVSCDNDGSSSGLLLCMGRPDLFDKVQSLALDRLTEIVEATGGDGRLAACMEDGACAECMQVLSAVSSPKTGD